MMCRIMCDAAEIILSSCGQCRFITGFVDGDNTQLCSKQNTWILRAQGPVNFEKIPVPKWCPGGEPDQRTAGKMIIEWAKTMSARHAAQNQVKWPGQIRKLIARYETEQARHEEFMASLPGYQQNVEAEILALRTATYNENGIKETI